MRLNHRRSALVIVSLAVVALGSACGGSDSPDTASS
jgi:hypothetical protein